MCSKPISGITTYLRPCPLVSLSVLRYLALSAQRLRQSRSSTVTLSSLTRVSVPRAGRESGSEAATRAIACPFGILLLLFSSQELHFENEDARRIEIVRNAATRRQISYYGIDVEQLPMETVRRP